MDKPCYCHTVYASSNGVGIYILYYINNNFLLSMVEFGGISYGILSFTLIATTLQQYNNILYLYNVAANPRACDASDTLLFNELCQKNIEIMPYYNILRLLLLLIMLSIRENGTRCRSENSVDGIGNIIYLHKCIYAKR